ncbi:flagellar biosynthesis protein FlhF [Ramlibacter humi]|uniref:Flagellar biosynthesis protein FlhF n=1 Tax=Ramlibacter humi TaxID=2530451 RepID=A0A4Z0C9T4_9BURK|nr:flagellar biosynthesis protein FlhF [Ramlibacter humi]TFZ08363.1 flagellar biosynthesis protein FlhF [Ramlibacter humi]
MNVKRFVGKNAREALAQARAACGDNAVVLSNRPVPGGVEILAMAGEDADAPELPLPLPAAAKPKEAPLMSTLSFQDYVRERQRQEAAPVAAQVPAPMPTPRRTPTEPGRFARQQLAEAALAEAATFTEPPRAEALPAPQAVNAAASEALMTELRSMHSAITRQLSGLAWFDNARRSPAQTRLLRLLVGNGFSPAMARELVARLPDDVPETQSEKWMLDMLSHNLRCAGDDGLHQRGGVYALVGPTGVGKTTTTAKIAAQFAQQHGPASVGLITVDTYRMAGSDQLRAFGSLLNIPVHTARDAASLHELLQLFAGRKLVLIDTVGLGQRDRRVQELLAGLPAKEVTRLLVLNAAVSGETLDQVAQAYTAGPGTRCVITKLDEAVRCGGAVDVALRHRLVVEGIANGQRVPEDWHRPHSQLLAQKALMKPAGRFAPDDTDLGLLLTLPPGTRSSQEGHHA